MQEPTCHPASVDFISGENIVYGEPGTIALTYSDPLVREGVISEDFSAFGEAPLCVKYDNLFDEIFSTELKEEVLFGTNVRKPVFKRRQHRDIPFNESGYLGNAVGIMSPYTVFRVTLPNGSSIGLTAASVVRLFSLSSIPQRVYLTPVFFDREVRNGIRKIPRIRVMGMDTKSYLMVGGTHGQTESALPIYSLDTENDQYRTLNPSYEMLWSFGEVVFKILNDNPNSRIRETLNNRLPMLENLFGFNVDFDVIEFYDTKNENQNFAFWDNKPVELTPAQKIEIRERAICTYFATKASITATNIAIDSNNRSIVNPFMGDCIPKTCETVVAYYNLDNYRLRFTDPSNLAELYAYLDPVNDYQSYENCRNKLITCPALIREYETTPENGFITGLDGNRYEKDDETLISQIAKCRDIISNYEPFQPRPQAQRPQARVQYPGCDEFLERYNTQAQYLINPQTGRRLKRLDSRGNISKKVKELLEFCAPNAVPQPPPQPQAQQPGCEEFMRGYNTRAQFLTNPLTGRRIKRLDSRGNISKKIREILEICAPNQQPQAPQPPPQPQAQQRVPSASDCEYIGRIKMDRRVKQLINPLTGRKINKYNQRDPNKGFTTKFNELLNLCRR